MFDPSKLNLDLEQNEAEKNKKASEKKSSESDKIQQAKTSIPEEKVIIQEDIVDDILEVAEKSDENNGSENITVTEENVSQTNHSSQEHVIRIQEDTETENTKNYGSGKEISYDKEKIVEQEKKDAQASQEEAKKIIYDINVKEIKDIFVKLIEHKYDFMTIEPFDSYVKLSFRKDKIEKESLNIKYPVYTQILIKAKTLTGLKVDDSQNAQEGK
jgi:type II secretory ATPase GspE/PulE/Tfp pilus assembly ATPase PilB-like protein